MGISLLSETFVGKPLLTYPSGSDFTLAVNQNGVTTVNPATGVFRAAPLIIYDKVIITAVRIEFVPGVGGSTLRLGLYNDLKGYPSSLIAGSDVGDISGATATVVATSYAAPIVLMPGLYWQVANASATQPTCRGVNVNAIAPVLGGVAAGGTSQNTQYSVGGTYGAMPATYPSGATLSAATLPPMAMYRVQ
jgi:hypothetical protein